MTTKNSKTQLGYKITSKFEINKQIKFKFQGNQRKTIRLSIFNQLFQLKKQNKSSVNETIYKYTKQCTSTKAIY